MTHLSQLIEMGKGEIKGEGESGWLDRSQVARSTGFSPDAIQRAAKSAMSRGSMMITLGDRKFKTQKKGQGFLYQEIP